MVRSKPKSDINAKSALLNKLWFAVLGLAIFFMFLYGLEFYLSLFSATATDLCRIGSGWGCRESMVHPWSKLLGLPVSIWAIASYTLLFSLPPRRWQQSQWRRIAGFIVVIQALVTIFFIYIIWRDFTELCPLCTSGHIANLLLLIIFISGRRLKLPHPPPALAIKKLILPSLSILLVGYLMQGWIMAAAQQKSIQTAITQATLLKSVVIGDYERYNLEADYQLIRGKKDAPHRLTVVGSLACGHCRKLLRQIQTLPNNQVEKISIWFVSYPLSSLCNPRVSKSADYEQAKCVLARKTLENQIAANFWPWFMTVDSQPGYIIRGADSQYAEGKIPHQLIKQIARTNETGINSIPRLFWDGQQLPDIFKKVPLADLLLPLLKTMETPDEVTEDLEDCGC